MCGVRLTNCWLVWFNSRSEKPKSGAFCFFMAERESRLLPDIWYKDEPVQFTENQLFDDLGKYISWVVDNRYYYRPLTPQQEILTRWAIAERFHELVDMGCGKLAVEAVKRVVVGETVNAKQDMVARLQKAVHFKEHSRLSPVHRLYFQRYLNDTVHKAFGLRVRT